jgi:hypothetical protein
MTIADFRWFGDVYQEIARQEMESDRKKKKIDRIAQRAEAMQRFQKRGSWK